MIQRNLHDIRYNEMIHVHDVWTAAEAKFEDGIDGEGGKRKKEETRRVWTIERWTGGSWSHRRAEGGTHRGPRRDRRREYYRSFVGQFPERFPHLGWKKWFSLTCAPRSTARRASLCSRRRLCWAISRCCLAAMLSSSLSTSTAPPPPTGN